MLNDVTFSVPKGSLVGIVGPNGAGKSTLLKALVGLIKLDSGEVEVLGKTPYDSRRSVSYIPQAETVNWDFPVTAGEVVMMGRTARIGPFRFPSREDRERAREALNRVGLEHREHDLLRELSGGQRQRAFVARALAQNAELLLLDESFSGVDVASQHELVDVLRTMCSEGKTVLMTTHDLNNLARTLDRVVCLNCHVCAYGTPEEAFKPETLSELYGAHQESFINF